MGKVKDEQLFSLLRNFLLIYLPNQRHASSNTVKAYRTVDCSPTSRQGNKSLSQNIEGLHGFAPDFIGSKAFFQVNALKIVEVDVLSNQFLNLSASRIPSTVQAFEFERTKEVFHSRVVVRTSGTGHGRPKEVFFA